jgi:hypothetical protein
MQNIVFLPFSVESFGGFNEMRTYYLRKRARLPILGRVDCASMQRVKIRPPELARALTFCSSLLVSSEEPTADYENDINSAVSHRSTLRIYNFFNFPFAEAHGAVKTIIHRCLSYCLQIRETCSAY